MISFYKSEAVEGKHSLIFRAIEGNTTSFPTVDFYFSAKAMTFAYHDFDGLSQESAREVLQKALLLASEMI